MPEFDWRGKLGPLPVWGWGIIVAVVALAAYFLLNRGGGYSANAATAGGSNLDALGYQTAGIRGGTAETLPVEPETNLEWLNRVARQVADTLAASPSAVYAALSKYLTGQNYTEQEKTYIDKALQIGMNPPEGVSSPGSVIPANSGAPGQWYYVRSTGRYYLINDGRRVTKTKADYVAAGSPHLTTVTVPVLNKISKRTT